MALKRKRHSKSRKKYSNKYIYFRSIPIAIILNANEIRCLLWTLTCSQIHRHPTHWIHFGKRKNIAKIVHLYVFLIFQFARLNPQTRTLTHSSRRRENWFPQYQSNIETRWLRIDGRAACSSRRRARRSVHGTRNRPSHSSRIPCIPVSVPVPTPYITLQKNGSDESHLKSRPPHAIQITIINETERATGYGVTMATKEIMNTQ